MARMNRHMAMLMRQLNGQDGESDQPEGEQPPEEGWFGTHPQPGFPNPGDIIDGLPNPGDLLGGVAQSG